jgi:ferric-dicitrate binding protein FerR (iron transport regulator)
MERNIPWDLLISHLKKETSPEEELELTTWRTISGNEFLYKEIIALWNEIIRDSSSYHPDTAYYWQQIEARMETMVKQKKTLFIPLHKIWVATVAASVFLIIAVFVSYLVTRDYYQPDLRAQTYKALNGKSQMILPDGSLVWLNIGSTLSYKTSFMKERRVLLDGEALFDVRHDSKHPFVVSAGDVRVHVYGTRFNVEAYPHNEHVKVALLDGSVTVSACAQELMINPGDIAFFSRKSHTLSKTKGDVVFESFWADHSFTFESKPLRYICQYLERWYNINIELDPSIADSQVYTFTITDEPLETILQIMSRINPVTYSFEEDKCVIIKNVSPAKMKMPMK